MTDVEQEYLDQHPLLRYFVMNLVAVEAEIYGPEVAVQLARSLVTLWVTNSSEVR